VTFGQIEELVEALPLHDQQRLIESVSGRLMAHQGYFARAQAFLNTCVDNPVRPGARMDSGEEFASMREERGSYLP
jgi:hypothetical protein